jgi:hypothetical protein
MHLRPRHVALGGLAIVAVLSLSFVFGLGRATKPAHDAYRRGSILGYMPADCPAGRVYVDVASLSHLVGSEELFAAMSQSKDLAGLMGAFDAAGIDVRRGDVVDFAWCSADKGLSDEVHGPTHAALGGSLGGKSALARYKSIVMMLAHVDDKSIVEQSRSGIGYLVSKYRPKRVWIGMPADDVLVFSTENIAELDGLVAPHAVAVDAWQATPDVAAAFDALGGRAARVRGDVKSEGATVVAHVTADLATASGLDAGKLETIRSATAAVLDKTALSMLSGPVREMAMTVADGKVSATLRVPGVTVGRALVATLKDPSLVKSILAELTRGPASGG